MSRRARLLPLLCLALLLLPLAGCWDQRQIADLVVVLGAGVDVMPPDEAKSGETIRLTVEMAQLTGDDNTGGAVLASAGGRTMMEAMRNLAQSLDKQLHWGHMQMLLIGEEAARAGIGQYLSLFYNEKDMSPHVYLALCDGSASDALRGRTGFSPYASAGLHDILLKHRNDANGYVWPFALQDYMSEHSLPRCGLVAPLVATRPAEEEGKPDSLYVKGLAVLDQQARYAGQLRPDENSGAALFLGQARDFVVALTEPNMKQQVSVELVSWQVKHSWQFDKQSGEIKLKLTGRADGILGETEESTHYNDQAAAAHLEQLFADELTRRIDLAWRRSMWMGVDFLGLGRQLYRHHLRQWNALLPEWPQAMRQVQLTVELETRVEIVGQSR